MSRFLDSFEGRQIGWSGGRSIWSTLAPLRYESVLIGGRVIVIPSDFVTDLASVPRLPLLWLAVGGRGIRSSVVHDWAYQRNSWLMDDGSTLPAEKALVDAVFYESLLADSISGVGPVRAWEMWAGVKIGGSRAWSDSRRAAVLNPLWTATGWPGEVP